MWLSNKHNICGHLINYNFELSNEHNICGYQRELLKCKAFSSSLRKRMILSKAPTGPHRGLIVSPPIIYREAIYYLRRLQRNAKHFSSSVILLHPYKLIVWTPFKNSNSLSVIFLQLVKLIVWTSFKNYNPLPVIRLHLDKLIIWIHLKYLK